MEYKDFFEDNSDPVIDKIEACEKEELKQEASFKTEKRGFLSVEHGWHKDDFVWHISLLRETVDWSLQPTVLYREILGIVYKSIPTRQELVLVPPKVYQGNIKVPVITVKAINGKNEWAIDDFALKQVLEDFLEKLPAFIKPVTRH